MLAITFISVSCYAPKDFEFIWFSNIVVSSVTDDVVSIVPDECYWSYLMNVIECTWWMLLIVPDECYWVYLMNVIERTWWMLLSVPDECYWAYLMNVIECTWWMLFQKHVVHTKFGIYVFITLYEGWAINHRLIN